MIEATLETGEGYAVVKPVGSARIWSFRSHLDIPLASITNVSVVADPRSVKWGLRLMGVGLPGVMLTGIVGWPWRRSWWCVGRGRPVVSIDIERFQYRRVVFSTADPQAAAKKLERAINRN